MLTIRLDRSGNVNHQFYAILGALRGRYFWGRANMQEFLERSDVPDMYVDSVRIGVGPYGFVLELGIQGLPGTPASEKPSIKRLAMVRMSPQHALILAKLLHKNVRAYEEKIGKINLPEKLFKDMDIEPE